MIVDFQAHVAGGGHTGQHPASPAHEHRDWALQGKLRRKQGSPEGRALVEGVRRESPCPALLGPSLSWLGHCTSEAPGTPCVARPPSPPCNPQATTLHLGLPLMARES